MDSASVTKELRSLMTRLSEVEGKMFDLKVENGILREEIDKLKQTASQNQTAQVTPGSADQSKFIQQLQGEISSLRKELKAMRKAQEKVDKRLHLLGGLQMSLNRVFAESQKKLQEGKEGNSLQDVVERTNRVEEKYHELARKFEAVYQKWSGGNMQRQLEKLDSKFPAVNKRLSALELKADTMDQADLFDIELNLKNGFESNSRCIFDECIEADDNKSGLFDTHKCVFRPNKDGKWALCVRISQNGEGEIWYRIFYNKISSSHCGRTHGDRDLLLFLRFVDVTKGQKIWLEASRKSGDCSVAFCSFYGWRIE